VGEGVNETSRFVEPFLVAAESAAKAGGTVRSNLAALGHLVAAGCGGSACVIAWRSSLGEGVMREPAGSRWSAALSAILAMAERQFEQRKEAGGESVHLTAARLVPLLAKLVPDDMRCEAVAKSVGAGSNHVIVVVVTPHGRRLSEIEAIVQLAANHALRVVNGLEETASRDFWRRRALEGGERIARTKSESAQTTADQRLIEEAVTSALKLQPRNRFAGLGSIFARLGPFESWIVATLEDGELRATAASAVLAPIPSLGADSALADSLKRNSLFVRSPGSTRTYHEDRLFARFSSYLCIPFPGAGIALAAHRPIDQRALAAVKALGARLGPVIKSWLAEAEVERLRRLVRNLGFRMFGAVDTERARIARDLHDHQAQLLTAARIAIEAGPDEARGIFKQLEDVLRLRVRELRPATLGRSTLEDALRYELRRLTDARIKGRLIHVDRMNVLTRPVQQLCYQVAREALSNVIRHSGATRVDISAEKRGGRVRLSILDNGKGIGDSAATNIHAPGSGLGGIGLSGLAERLELMGGKLRLESHKGSTRVIAEIPEPA
jgi:signal transduction histidine kinase